MKNILRHRIPFVLAILILSFPFVTFAQENKELSLANAKSHWTFLGGYGVTHKGLGATETKVETAELILSYGHFLSEEVGKSWYRGRHEIIVELPLHYVVSPETTPMVGITFLACWNFTALGKTVPYVFAGGGLIYTDLNVPELGRRLNGTHQVGAGLNYFISKNTSLNFNYRFHHISNAGTATPNGPLNSSKFLFGISFFR